jgi:hypothetical protein
MYSEKLAFFYHFGIPSLRGGSRRYVFMKIKVKSLHLTKHHAMTMSGSIALRIFNLDIGYYEWSASRPGSFTAGEESLKVPTG